MGVMVAAECGEGAAGEATGVAEAAPPRPAVAALREAAPAPGKLPVSPAAAAAWSAACACAAVRPWAAAEEDEDEPPPLREDDEF